MPDAQTTLARCDALAALTETPGQITRRFATAPMAAANTLVAQWMRAAGMTAHVDAAGNLVGRYAAAAPNAPTLLLGSHLDSVRDAGRYDGPLGVLTALAALERLHAQRRRLPFALEVLGFSDEEGVRYGTAYLGSSALAGSFDPAWLSRTDDAGVTLAAALRAFGGDPDALGALRRDPATLLGYLEVHIEQGPVLEDANQPVGVVGAIAGQARYQLVFRGSAGHAGTVPMRLRRDALAACAAFVLAAEDLASTTDGLVATVGQIAAHPGASNVIPGTAMISLDVRHALDPVLEQAVAALQQRAAAICAERGVTLAWQEVQRHTATPCDPQLTQVLAAAAIAHGATPLTLPSGAGHDAVVLADVCPVAMLFVRCAGGVSHNPAEAVSAADLAVALNVLCDTLERLAVIKSSHNR